MTERRGFLKSLMAGTVVGFPAVKSVEILELKPGDTLVLNVAAPISTETAARLREAVREKFPENEVLVLSEGLELKVLRG